MKDFIVLIAILPILLLFSMQTVQDNILNEKLYIIQDKMYTSKELAKQRGCFDDEIAENLVSDLSQRLGIPEDDIEFTFSTDRKNRYSDDKIIHYKLKVKMNNVMAGADFVGIAKEDNSFYYIIDSYTASEYIETQ